MGNPARQCGTGYTNDAYPNTSISAYHTINYYDDYNIPNLPQPYNKTGNSLMTKSLLTATKTAVLNDLTQMLWTVNYYDDEGRVTKQYAQHFKGGGTANANNYDEISNTYNFTNQLTQSTRRHFTTQSTTAPQLTIANEYTYDHMGRKIDTKEKINDGSQVVLARNTYNELGQLKNKELHSENSGSNFMQNIAYNYNERGWLIYINDPASLSAQKSYGLQLYYNNHPNPALNQYNGNISAMVWQSKVPAGLGLMQQAQITDYSYDRLNRLTLARYTTNGKVDQFNEGLSYDKAGDIRILERYKNGTKIDGLSYTYQNNMSNRLASVNDNSGNNEGQLNGLTSYGYDDNGNLKTDDKKGINITNYNYLNLPQTITKGSEILTYVYDTTGRKLRKVIGNQSRDYIGGIEYNNGTVEFIQTEEGRAIPSGQGFTYEYMLKDHLGNTRVTIDGSGSIKQVQDYYAFGMEMNPNTSYTATPNNQYKYNGKELQNELSLNQYDYGARFYDPVIGRFNTVDPLAEKFFDLSPYNYTDNNPVNNTDPDGMDIIYGANSTTFTGADAMAAFSILKNSQQGSNGGGDDDKKKNDDKKKKLASGEILGGLVSGLKDLANALAPIRPANEDDPESLSEWWEGIKNAPSNSSDIYSNGSLEDKTRLTTSLGGLFRGKKPSVSGIAMAGMKGESRLLYFGKIVVDRDVFHRVIKPKILNSAGSFSSKVGNNPDIKVVGGQIHLTGTGPFKGKSFPTNLKASNYLTP